MELLLKYKKGKNNNKMTFNEKLSYINIKSLNEVNLNDYNVKICLPFIHFKNNIVQNRDK